jgi:hypothetical protein
MDTREAQQGDGDAQPLPPPSISCPRNLVGRVIGKHGITVKGIQRFTGVCVEINQATDPASITFFGDCDSILVARNMIADILESRFKGFALLRELASERDRVAADRAGRRFVYIPGTGLLPRHRVKDQEEAPLQVTAAERMGDPNHPYAAASGVLQDGYMLVYHALWLQQHQQHFAGMHI